jgi:hypothetical protein
MHASITEPPESPQRPSKLCCMSLDCCLLSPALSLQGWCWAVLMRPSLLSHWLQCCPFGARSLPYSRIHHQRKVRSSWHCGVPVHSHRNYRIISRDCTSVRLASATPPASNVASLCVTVACLMIPTLCACAHACRCCPATSQESAQGR